MKIELTEKELEALNWFLEYCSQNLSSAGCNDLDQEMIALFTPEQGIQIAKEFAIINNPITPDGPDWPIPDFCLLAYLRHKLNQAGK